MKVLILSGILLATPVFACWQMTGVLKYEQGEVRINQKVEHDKTYSFQAGDAIFNLKIIPKDKKLNVVTYDVVKKDKRTLSKINEGSFVVKDGLEKIETNELTTLTIKLKHI